MKIDFDVVGEDIAAGHMEQIAERARNAKPAMEKVRDVMLKSNAEQFASHGGHLDTPWAPLAEATLERKSRKGQPADPLVATGALESSMTGGKGRRTGAAKTTARAGTKLWYAKFAQVGTSKGEPARPLAGLNTGDQVRVIAVVREYIFHGILP